MNLFFKMALLLLLEVVSSEQDTTIGATPTKDLEGSSKVLSRRKRYLIFPDGSSFQLVFCTQTHGYLQIGDVVWFGSTAALAWELPTDPKLFNFFKKHDKLHTAENRDGVSKLIYFLDENGKVLSKMPYKKKPLVNPAFAKRSVNGNADEWEDLKNITTQDLHERRKNMNIFDFIDKDEIEFHREGRKNLYVQLETFIEGLGWRGRECVLRLLCESGKGRGQSTFLEEIIRATFTLPQERKFEDNIHDQYDTAFRAKADCVDLYPQCEEYTTK